MGLNATFETGTTPGIQ